MKYLSALLPIVLVFVSCAEKREAGRPGVDETSNGITATIVDSSGKEQQGVQVIQLACGYGASPDTILLSDSLGKVTLDTASWGEERCLEVRGESGAARVQWKKKEITSLEQITLVRTSPFRGKVNLPPNQTHALIQVFGLSGSIKTRRGGEFTWDQVPAGLIEARALLLDTPVVIAQAKLTLGDGVDTVVQMTPVPQDTSGWKYKARISLNTSSTGAKLGSTLYQFPVLLRLAGDQFPSEASEAGADFRLEKSNGDALPFEIMKWDASAKEALVWVLVDTLFKNTKQEIKMRWGNPYAVSASVSAQVFDTAQGWSGVWHLAQTYQDEQNRIRTPDATYWKQDGVLHGFLNWGVSPLTKTLQFDGFQNSVAIGSDGIEIDNNNFTLELWAKVENAGAELVHLGDVDTVWDRGEKRVFLGTPGMPYLTSFGWRPTFLGRRVADNIYAPCSTDVVASEWVHLVLRRTRVSGDSGVVDWFINGEPSGDASFRHVLESDNAEDSIHLGNDVPGNARLIRGALAEFRFSQTARSAEWIRMDHYQQDPSNKGWISIFKE